MFVEFGTETDTSRRHLLNFDHIERADTKPGGLLMLSMTSGEVLTLDGAAAQKVLQAIEPPQA